jgi:hypothetical protein
MLTFLTLIIVALLRVDFPSSSLFGYKSSTQYSVSLHEKNHPPDMGTLSLFSFLLLLTRFPVPGISFWLVSLDLCGACF